MGQCARAAQTPVSTITAAQAREPRRPRWGVRRSHPTPPRACGPCQPSGSHPKRASLTGRAGTVAARCQHRRSRRPCHPRAISSGHERYPADNHGHSEKTVGLGARALTCGGGGGRNCMACKGSGVQIPSAPPQVRGPIRPQPPPDRPPQAADWQQPPSSRPIRRPPERHTGGAGWRRLVV
jgi:hypothetical protein